LPIGGFYKQFTPGLTNLTNEHHDRVENGRRGSAVNLQF